MNVVRDWWIGATGMATTSPAATARYGRLGVFMIRPCEGWPILIPHFDSSALVRSVFLQPYQRIPGRRAASRPPRREQPTADHDGARGQERQRVKRPNAVQLVHEEPRHGPPAKEASHDTTSEQE